MSRSTAGPSPSISRETQLRRQFAAFFTLALVGVALSLLVGETVGAMVLLPSGLGLASVIHRFGRLGSD